MTCWISASEVSNERIRQALTSAFKNSGMELTFRQACTAEKTGEVEFLDVSITEKFSCWAKLRHI